MRNRQSLLFSISLILICGFLLGACKRASSSATPASFITPIYTPSLEATSIANTSPQPYPVPGKTSAAPPTSGAYPQPGPVIASETGLPYPQPPGLAGSPTASPSPLQSATHSKTLVPSATQTQTPKSPTPTVTIPVTPQYPGPGDQPTNTQPYPGPVDTNTPLPSPGPATSTPGPTRTPSRSVTPVGTQIGSTTPPQTPTSIIGTPQVTTTELPPRPPISPPPAGSSVTVWYSWGGAETEALKSIIQSFQRIYPDVTFSLLYVPLDDLFKTYQGAAYLGQGPSLLLGPAQWGPKLFDSDLITDLNPYVPADYLASINPAALASGEYHKALISLPLSQHGMLMFRNTTIIDTAPKTFEELISLSHQVTHGGVVGSYLERGSFFSAANIIGLGGRIINDNGYPAFNDSFGLEWFSLLTDYNKTGAVTFNTNRDLDMFKRGRVGIIIDGSWNTSSLADIIGQANLAIDPWLTYGTGYMSGWVESDSVFLNANTTGNDRFAALAFMGYLLDPNVQRRLAEVGHIPSVSTTVPRDAFIHQSMEAFSHGVPYPIGVDASILKLYWNELDKAIQKVFISGVNPANALKAANDNLIILLRNMGTSP
jgi:arabinogalactan oligomer/maltooligosaccharide transport system substrate-binding protein